MPTALGSVLWQRRHLGSWALAFLPLVFPAKAGTQGPRSTGRQPKGHRAAKGSAARRVLFFKRAQAPRRRSAHSAEVRAVAAGPPRPLDPRFPTPRFPGEGRDPGTTAHWTATKRTSGRQRALRPGKRHLFTTTRTSCRRKFHCIEVRSVAAGPPRLLGPRFRGGNERGMNSSIVPAECPLHWVRSVAAAPPRPLGPRFCGGSGVGRAGSGRKTRGKGPSPVPVVHTICG